MVNYKKNYSEPLQSAVEGSTLTAVGSGNVPLFTKLGFDVTLKDVLHCPNVNDHLIAENKLDKQGMIIVTNNGVKKIYLLHSFNLDDSRLIATATCQRNGLYKLDLGSLAKTNKSPALYSCSQIINWHKRLGHTNDAYLDYMVKENYIDQNRHDNSYCRTCIMEKGDHLPIPKISDSIYNNPLDLVYFDTVTINEPNHLNTKYFITFTDAFSKYSVVYLMKHKDESFQKYKMFERETENLFSTNIKLIQCDNAKEFPGADLQLDHTGEGVNHHREWTQHLGEKGTRIRFSTPYEHYQNGSAEIVNKIIENRARCLLKGAHVPMEFWPNAIETAVYLKNLSPIKSKGTMFIPYERWFGKKPTYQHLRVWGCDAYSTIPKEIQKKNGKLDSKSIAVRFLGYSQVRKAYVLWDPKGHKFMDSVSVRFIEDSFLIPFNMNTGLDIDDLDNYLIIKL
jgi:hypothetical protein